MARWIDFSFFSGSAPSKLSKPCRAERRSENHLPGRDMLIAGIKGTVPVLKMSKIFQGTSDG